MGLRAGYWLVETISVSGFFDDFLMIDFVDGRNGVLSEPIPEVRICLKCRKTMTN